MIPYSRQSISSSDIQSVTAILHSDFITTGPAVEAFEAALCSFTGAHYAVACANGTAALHLACLALGVGKGDLGLTSPLTFLASANCIEYCGGRTGFIDIDPTRLALSPDALDEWCKKKRVPKVVIPVDYAGIPADLPQIYSLAKKHGFAVIEDAAHSLGSFYTYKGRRYACGSCAHSDLATLSFHPVKNITTGEGGAVLTNSPKLADKLRLLRSHGMVKRPAKAPWYYDMADLGFNYRITDIQCGLGISQIKRLAEFKKRREALASAYDNSFAGIRGLVIPPRPNGTDPCHHLYPIRFTAGEKARRTAYDALLKQGIRSQVHYIPVYWQPYYEAKYGTQRGLCPEAERFYHGCLSLPLYPGLKDSQQQKVISTILECIP